MMPLTVTFSPAQGLAAPEPWTVPMGMVPIGQFRGATGSSETPLLTGVGAPAVKSAALLSVSGCAAVSLLDTDVALLVPGAGPVPSKGEEVLPHATRSTTAEAPSTRRTLPPVPDRARVPVAFGVGRSVVPPLPAASLTR